MDDQYRPKWFFEEKKKEFKYISAKPRKNKSPSRC